MTSYIGRFKAAAVQVEPVWLDADATIEKAIGLIEEAARNDARIIAFPEVFIPGYPYWAWIGDVKWGLKFLERYHENSLELGDERMRRCDIDDASPSALLHAWDRCLHAVEHARQIDGDDRVPTLGRKILDVRCELDASVVHQNIQRT